MRNCYDRDEVTRQLVDNRVRETAQQPPTNLAGKGVELNVLREAGILEHELQACFEVEEKGPAKARTPGVVPRCAFIEVRLNFRKKAEVPVGHF